MQQREVVLRIRSRILRIDAEGLIGFALDVLGELGLEGTVGIEVCGAKRSAALNGEYRKKDGPTDVLAFPDGEADETGRAHLGDLVLCAPVVAANAEALGHGADAELRRMVLHGLLHLAGYDHETDRGRMTRKERALAGRWGLPA